MKRALRIFIATLLLTPVIVLAWLATTESGLHWACQQAEAYLPGKLSINTLRGRLIGPITLEGIEYRHNGALIRAEQILFDWQPGALLTTSIDVSRVHIRALEIVLPPAEKTEQQQARVLTLPDIHLPWRLLLKDAQIDGFQLSQGEQGVNLKQIRLNATTLFSQVDIRKLSLSADGFSLNIKGKLQLSRNYRHDLEMDWQAKLPSSAVINGAGRLDGDMEKSRLKQELRGPLQLTLNAELTRLLERLNWQASVDVAKFDTSQLDSHWPALSGKLKLDATGDLNTASVSGRANGDYAETGPFDAEFRLQRLAGDTIQIDQLKLHAARHDTRLDASGQWQPGAHGGEIKLALNWQNLRWPAQDPPWFNSASGSGSIEGKLDRYQIQLTTDSPWPQAAPSSWHARAEGNLEGLTFHSLRVTALNGEAVASGQLNWSPVLSWKAEISATDIDPASRWPQWPGRLNARLTSSGRYKNSRLSIDADISQLEGRLRGYPVTLRSTLSWRNQGLDLARFDLHSGDAQISAQGRVAKTLKLDWTITASNLAELYPGAEGQLQARGLLSGPQDAPMIKTSFNGKALKLLDYEIGSIEGTLAMDLFRWRQIDIQLAAQALRLNDYALQTLDIHADTRRMEVQASSKEASAQIELRGEVDAKGWRGRIEKADIQSAQFANWRLRTPAMLNISQKTLTADTLCWHNSQQGGLCTSIKRADDAWQLQLEMNKFPLLLFSPWLPADLTLEGVVDATAELQYQAPDKLLGHARLELPPGSVSYPLLEGERDRWQYRHGKAEITLDNQGLKAASEIAMSNGDRFHARLSLPEARLPALNSRQQPLQASLQLNIHDPGLIEAIVPEVHDLRGEAELNLSVAGTLAQPRLNGRAHLLNGAFRIPRLGLSIDQLSLRGQTDAQEKFNFNLEARSGDGRLAIQGNTTLDRSTGWPTEISIKGDQFEVSRIPEAQVKVSPDLQIKLQQHTIDVKGNVHIPYAKLQPKDITTAARVSEDTVIVGNAQAAEEKWLISTRVRLTLGERVNFFGFGFEGRFGGSLLLIDEPGQLTTATGELNIPEGRYRAYGQRLDVEHGRLLYTGGPLSNPGLDLRAVRHIDNITAGLKVRGSLKQPQMELFSIPAMGQTDALSYLLLGRPVENASGEEGSMMAKAALALGLSGGDRLARVLGGQFGLDEMRVESSDRGDQASLTMGRYLSPKLYVSYGVGLIGSFNTLTVRYQISDQWQLKSESGEYQGTDILYTIER